MKVDILYFLFIILPCSTNIHVVDIVDVFLKTMDLKCAVVVVHNLDNSHGTTRKLYSIVNYQVKVVLFHDVEKMRNLARIGKCGIFIDRGDKDFQISQYIEKILEVNKFDHNIFKQLHWFISLEKEESLEFVFRFDSQVFLMIDDQYDSNI